MHYGVDITEVDAVSEARGQAQGEHAASEAKTSCNPPPTTRRCTSKIVGAPHDDPELITPKP